MVFRFKAAM